MISRLILSNFKSHRNTQLSLANLTLLTGMNNCGKSSVLQALLLLRQSYKKGRLMQGLDLNEPLTSVGIANDAMYKYAQSGEVTFSLTYNATTLSFSFNADNNALEASFIPRGTYSDTITADALASLPLFGNDFQYISAWRWGGRSNFPKDTYSVEAEHQMSHTAGQCELLGNYLYKYQNDIVYDYIRCDGTTTTLLSQIVEWESRISAGVTVAVNQTSDKGGYNIQYGCNLDTDQKPLSGIKAQNIGFGISYSLPVITALVHAKPGALLLIENPEAHMHQEGEAQLAMLIARAAQRGVQVIIETHSNNIINGVLVACKKHEKQLTGIDRRNVAVYYFDKLDSQYASTPVMITINSNGVTDKQPKGFFDKVEEDLAFLTDCYS